MIFATDDHEKARFFVGFMGRAGSRLTMLEPPSEIGELLGSRMRKLWPKKIASPGAAEAGVYTVELKAGFGSECILFIHERIVMLMCFCVIAASQTTKDQFISFALQEIRAMGYELHATLPMAKRGPFGLGSGRELWIFRMIPGTRPRSR